MNEWPVPRSLDLSIRMDDGCPTSLKCGNATGRKCQLQPGWRWVRIYRRLRTRPPHVRDGTGCRAPFRDYQAAHGKAGRLSTFRAAQAEYVSNAYFDAVHERSISIGSLRLNPARLFRRATSQQRSNGSFRRHRPRRPDECSARCSTRCFQGDALSGCSTTDAMTVLSILASFHARWWTMRRLQLTGSTGSRAGAQGQSPEWTLSAADWTVPHSLERLARSGRSRIVIGLADQYGDALRRLEERRDDDHSRRSAP